MTRAEWLANLRSGTRVAVVDAPSGYPSDRTIHYGIIRRARTGAATFWIRSVVVTGERASGMIPGAGPRAIVPVDANGKITKSEEP